MSSIQLTSPTRPLLLPLWQLAVATIGPLFVVLFIWRVSGVPLLEKAAKKRWGDDPAFQAYVARTRLLAPLPKLGGFLTGYEEF